MEVFLVPKSSTKFRCNFCDYSTSRKSQFERHCSTSKHIKLTKWKDLEVQIVPKVPDFICENCNKKYANHSGLWKHKQKCKNDTNIQLTNLVLEVVKSNQDMQKQLVEVCKNIQPHNTSNSHNNSHNKTFNLNMFLNEQCKDAMNLTDFVDSLQFQLSDLEKVGELGYVAGLSDMIIRNLKALDIFKRPVHCSDAKRETIFIKEADKWEKENDNKEQLNKAIKTIANKNIRMIPKWREKYPECGSSDSCKSDQYNNIIIQSLDTNPNSNPKIISNIAKEVKIEKD